MIVIPEGRLIFFLLLIILLGDSIFTTPKNSLGCNCNCNCNCSGDGNDGTHYDNNTHNDYNDYPIKDDSTMYYQDYNDTDTNYDCAYDCDCDYDYDYDYYIPNHDDVVDPASKIPLGVG